MTTYARPVGFVPTTCRPLARGSALRDQGVADADRGGSYKEAGEPRLDTEALEIVVAVLVDQLDEAVHAEGRGEPIRDHLLRRRDAPPVPHRELDQGES